MSVLWDCTRIVRRDHFCRTGDSFIWDDHILDFDNVKQINRFRQQAGVYKRLLYFLFLKFDVLMLFFTKKFGYFVYLKLSQSQKRLNKRCLSLQYSRAPSDSGLISSFSYLFVKFVLGVISVLFCIGMFC